LKKFVTVLLTRYPPNRPDPPVHDEHWYFREYCDVTGGGFASWWFTETEGKIEMTGKVIPWFDLLASESDLQQSNNPAAIGRSELAQLAAAQSNEYINPLTDLLIVVADVIPPPPWTLDKGTTGLLTYSFLAVVTPIGENHDFTAHEIGHCLGLNHSFDLTTQAGGVLGEYGHPYCIMSAETFGGRLAAAVVDPPIIPGIADLANKGPGLNGGTRFAKGWAAGEDVTLAPGTNFIATISSLGSEPLALTNKIVNIIKNSNETFAVEFRSPVDENDRSLPCPMILISGLKGSLADQWYPNQNCATYYHQIRATDPAAVTTGFNFKVELMRVTDDLRLAVVRITDAPSPWADWFPINRINKFDLTTPICAVSRYPGSLDLFKVSKSGAAAWSTWPNEALTWQAFLALPVDRTFPPQAPIAAVGRLADHLDVFATATDGKVVHCWWQDDGEGWRNWEEIDPQHTFRQDRPICVLSRRSNHIDLFQIGNNNTIWHAWWGDGDGWQPWAEIHPETTFSQQAFISGLARTPNNIDLFSIRDDGQVWGSSWQDGEDWKPWRQIPGASFKPAQSVVAVARVPDHIDLFAMGDDGVVRSTFGTGAPDGWNPWFPLPAPQAFSPDAQVSALARRSDQLDVFVTDSNGQVWTTWWNQSVGWQPWGILGGVLLQPNQQATAIARYSEHIDLFHLGTDGTTWSTFWPASSGETPPPAPSPVLYSINSAGQITWHRHDGAWEGKNSWSIPHPMRSDWQLFTSVFGGGGGVVYGIQNSGDLKWLKHNGRAKGLDNWQAARTVGYGWQDFRQVFADGEGHIYALKKDGTLLWHKHPYFQTAKNKFFNTTSFVSNPTTVKSGLQNIQKMLAAGSGIIYAVQNDGTLLWLKHVDYASGGPSWLPVQVVGHGWGAFAQIVAAEQNTVYALQGDGNLLWYRHQGANKGIFAWSGPKLVGLAADWTGISTLFSS
jgi:hypothetical protein